MPHWVRAQGSLSGKMSDQASAHHPRATLLWRWWADMSVLVYTELAPIRTRPFGWIQGYGSGQRRGKGCMSAAATAGHALLPHEKGAQRKQECQHSLAQTHTALLVKREVKGVRLRLPQQGVRSSRITKELSATRNGSTATIWKHMRGVSLCTISPTTAALTTFPTACHAPDSQSGLASYVCRVHACFKLLI